MTSAAPATRGAVRRRSSPRPSAGVTCCGASEATARNCSARARIVESRGGFERLVLPPPGVGSHGDLRWRRRSHRPRRCERASAAASRACDGRSKRSKPMNVSPTKNIAPTCPSTGTAARDVLVDRPDMTIEDRLHRRRRRVRLEAAGHPAMSAQTPAWSDTRSPRTIIDCDTWAMRLARPVAYCVRGAAVNWRDRDRQRPASTHDTGMVSSELAATRIERLTTRFCLAPRSSSPSTMRTGRAPRFTSFKSGTLPASEISVISTAPADRASSRTDVVEERGSRIGIRGSGFAARLLPNQGDHRQVVDDDGRAEDDRVDGGCDDVREHAPTMRSDPGQGWSRNAGREVRGARLRWRDGR